MKQGINGEILRIVGEIIVILLFLVVSFNLFTESRLASFASTAAKYDNADYDLQVLYGHNMDAVLTNEDLLDKGVLSIKNPNKKVVTANVSLKISDKANLDLIKFVVNGKDLDITSAKKEDNYYIVDVDNYSMGAYEDKEYETSIYGNPFYVSSFDYDYVVTESFYN